YDDELRLGAIRVLDAFARRNLPTGLSIQHFDQFLHDPVERIRELALSILRHADDPEQHDLMLIGLKDPSITVRRTAVRVLVELGNEIIPLLVTTSEAKHNDPITRKMATVALAHLQRQRYQRPIEDYIVADLSEIYHNHRQLTALAVYQASSQGIRILRTTLHEQNEHHLDDIFYLLTALAPAASVATIREALESDSATIKASSIEALESVVSAQTARWISFRFDDRDLDRFMAAMMEQTGVPARLRPEAALRQLILDQDDSWLRATAAFALGEIEGLFTEADRETLFKKALADSYADVRQAARAGARRRGQTQEQPMLSQIERIMFLKQVSIFQSIPLEQLKAIAAVCEPEAFPAKAIIFKQGEASSGLYVVTAGQVAIQVHGHRTETIQLATLEVNAYFGEMSLFNNRPRSASALAIQATEVLKLSRTSFIRLVRQFPEMSLTLLDVLSQRLAEVNEQLAEK
ncbi:MAG: cyclic nucleotide-binding domain-containing protein, partial [Anaerolineae bacterium]|nr:cyclic nucleotide-binding domain-containing protein [Anaerolineae bacterium]